MGERILIIEDDARIASMLRRGLIFEGFDAAVAYDGRAGLDAARDRMPDLVVLDLMLPEIDGMEVCRRLRADGDVPILILTARESVPDRVAGLDAGADDYMVKPIDLDELAARLRAIERRVAGRSEPAIVVGDIVVEPATRTVLRGGEPVDLTARELAVLLALARRPGATVSREQLVEALYGWEESIESNAIDVHIHHLRRKLGADVIETQRGLGWRLAGGRR